MDKKANLLPEEVLKIVIAVIGIILLVYLAFSLYGLITKKTEIEQARESSDELFAEVLKIDNNEINMSEVFIEGPNDWQIVSFPFEDFTGFPSRCKKDYCICICPVPSLSPWDPSDPLKITRAIERAVNECDSTGFCKDVLKKVTTVNKEGFNSPLEISGPMWLNITLKDKEVWIEELG